MFLSYVKLSVNCYRPLNCNHPHFIYPFQKDVNKEFFLLFSVTDENESWYIKRNINKFASEPNKIDMDDEDFKESNLMHGKCLKKKLLKKSCGKFVTVSFQ